MKRLAGACILLALAAAPAAAVPSDNPIPPNFPQDARWEAPPIWVSYHGLERWIFDPVGQCIGFATGGAVCPSAVGGDTRQVPAFAVRRGEVMVFHFAPGQDMNPPDPRRFAIKTGVSVRPPGTRRWIANPKPQAQKIPPGESFAWRVTGRSGIATMDDGWSLGWTFRLVISGPEGR
jgi:hypothetical protein